MLRGPKKIEIHVSEKQREVLNQLIRLRSTQQFLVKRARLIRAAAEGVSNTEISRNLPLDRPQVVLWRGRWIEASSKLCVVEQEHPAELEDTIVQLLSDQARPGTPPTFTEQQILQMVALSCEDPAACDRPISHWTPREVQDEAIKRGIVSSISISQVRRFLK